MAIALTGFCGPIGALYSCAHALVTSAARIARINVFIFFLSFEACKSLPVATPADIIAFDGLS